MTRAHSSLRTVLPERNLDVLRSIAVLLVLVDHLANALVGHVTPAAHWLGQAGVQAFFVHTSLVLMGSMEKDNAPSRAHWVRRFYIRRAWRIYPLAIVVIGVVLLLHVPSRNVNGTAETFTLSEILANIAMVQDLLNKRYVLGVLWTLPLELQMYVALPLCYLVARRRSFAGMLALLLGGFVLAIVSTLGVNSIPGIWRFPVLSYVPCFLPGVLAYWLLRRASAPILPSWLWIPIVIAALLLGFGVWAVWPESWAVRAGYCLMLGVAIPYVADLASSTLTRIAHTIATYSYGIYLLHPIALWFGFQLLRDQPGVVQALGIVSALVLGCLAAYHGIEKPGIEWGRSIVHGRTALETEPGAP